MSDDDSDFTAHVYGAPIIIRGVEREVTETANASDDEFVDLWFHVDYRNAPERATATVNISEVSCEGGLSALTDHLVERGLVPEWWAENDPVPDTLD